MTLLRTHFIRSILFSLLLFFFFMLPASAFAQSSDTGLIQPCVTPSGQELPNLVPGQAGCRDANLLLLQLIKIAEYLFGIIGMLAFVFFIYGGFQFIISMGNAEKAKQGLSTLLAAAVGLLISFSAYILVQFLLDALGVPSEFINLF